MTTQTWTCRLCGGVIVEWSDADTERYYVMRVIGAHFAFHHFNALIEVPNKDKEDK